MEKIRTYGNRGNEYVWSKKFEKVFDPYRLGFIDGIGHCANINDESLNEAYNHNIKYYSGFEDAIHAFWNMSDTDELMNLYNNLCKDLDNEYHSKVG